MSVSGLVITLSRDPAAAGDALKSLRANQRLVIGDLKGRSLALAAETDSHDEDLALIEVIRSTPGVERVEIVFVGLDEACRCDSSSAPTEHNSGMRDDSEADRRTSVRPEHTPKGDAMGVEP